MPVGRRGRGHVSVLGCDGSYPAPGGAGSGYLVQCGPPPVARRRAGHLRQPPAGPRSGVGRHVVLSHEHPDHWTDLESFAVWRRSPVVVARPGLRPPGPAAPLVLHRRPAAGLGGERTVDADRGGPAHLQLRGHRPRSPHAGRAHRPRPVVPRTSRVRSPTRPTPVRTGPSPSSGRGSARCSARPPTHGPTRALSPT